MFYFISIFYTSGQTMFKCISKQNWIKIYHLDQEL